MNSDTSSDLNINFIQENTNNLNVLKKKQVKQIIILG